MCWLLFIFLNREFQLAAGDYAERPCFSLLRELHEKLLGRTLDKHEFLQDEVKCLTRVEIR